MKYSVVLPDTQRFLCQWVVALFTLVLVSAVAMAEEPRGSDTKSVAYPLGVQLRVLDRDLTSKDYRDVLETMISTDLAAEWLRVATPDNHITFLKAHGGKVKVLADPRLKAAYLERRRIADEFLNLMRPAYKKRGRRPPFDTPGRIEKLLSEASQREDPQRATSKVTVRVVMPAAGAELQWPRFRGPTGQGTAIETRFPLVWDETRNVIWKIKLPGLGNSSPIVWDERLFVTAASKDGRQRLLLCYARDDGKPLWQRSAPAPQAAEKLYRKNTYASSTPVTDGKYVIALFGNSGLVCYDLKGGFQWHQPLGPFTTMHGPGTSPLLYKNMVIVIQYQNRGETLFAAFDKKSGRKLWQHKRPNAMCWSTPVVLRVGDHDELVYNGSHHVIGYDPQTGNELWRFSGPSREAIPTIVVGGGLIYSTSGRNGPTLAFRPGGRGDLTDTHLQWRAQRGGPHVPSPVYFKDRLFMVNDTGIVTCIDATTGRTRWQKRLRGRFSMSPILAGDRLLLTNEEGRTYILKAGDRFQVLAENDLKATTLATPAVLGGRIYFRAGTHLLCIGESDESAGG